MLIVSIDDKEALTLYQSWWKNPEVAGIPKGSEEYYKLQKMWEEATGKKITEPETSGEITGMAGKMVNNGRNSEEEDKDEQTMGGQSKETISKSKTHSKGR